MSSSHFYRTFLPWNLTNDNIWLPWGQSCVKKHETFSHIRPIRDLFWSVNLMRWEGWVFSLFFLSSWHVKVNHLNQGRVIITQIKQKQRGEKDESYNSWNKFCFPFIMELLQLKFFTLADLSSIPFSSNRKRKFNSLRSKPGYALMVNLRSNVGRDWRNKSLGEAPIQSWQIHSDSWQLWLPP